MSRLAALLLGALLAAAAAPPELVEIPWPELAAVEEDVRRQLEAGRSALEKRLAAGGERQALALAFGELGQRYHAYELTASATACYENARRMAPEEARWAYLLGFLQQMDGDLEAARESLEVASVLAPRDTPTLLRLGQIAFDLAEVDRSETYARAALELDPESAAAYYQLGKVATARREHILAVEYFERTLALAPRATRVHYALAQAYRRLGRGDEALRHLEQQGTIDVGFPDPLLAALGETLAGAGLHMQNAIAARAADDIEGALRGYRRAVEADPKNAEARQGLGVAMIDAGDIEGAVEQFRETLRLDVNQAFTHYNLAVLLATHGEAEEAIEHFRAAVELEPEHAEFRLRLAVHLAAAGRFAEAIEGFEHLVASDPNLMEARLKLAMARVEQGDLEGAMRDSGAVLALDARAHEKASAHHVQAAVRLRRGETRRAMEQLEQAVRLHPELADAHFTLANLLGQAGRFEEAAASYRRVIEIDAKNSPARLGEATALTLAGRDAEAVQRLREGITATADPRLAHALARLLVSTQDPAVRDGPLALEMTMRLFEAERSFEHAETLALALAEVGRFADAVELQRSLLAQVRGHGDAALEERLRGNLERFEQGAASEPGS